MARTFTSVKLIAQYQYDLDTGVPLSRVVDHARRQVEIFRKFEVQASQDTADQLEQWLKQLTSSI